MFKVGKKYTDSRHPDYIYECMFVGKQMSFFERTEKSSSIVIEIGIPNINNNLVEYKEPIVHKRYVHWFRASRNGRIMSQTDDCPTFLNSDNLEWLKTDEVSYTEEE